MLELEAVDVFRAQAHVLRSLSLQVRPGEAVALLGANGAGKTTTFETIFGLHAPKAGAVRFEGRLLSGLRPFEIARRGLSCVPEGRRLFGEMTVLENLELGAYAARAHLQDSLRRAFSLFPVLSEKRELPAATLSGGQQQMLAIGRALMARPKLLLLDELSSGLSPKAAAEIFSALTRLRGEGLTLLLSEQNAQLALRFCDRAYVLEAGAVALSGTGAELLDHEHMRKAYLGL